MRAQTRKRKPTLFDESWDERYKHLWHALPRCASCDRKLRPATKGLSEWPQTVSRASTDMCQSCYKFPVEPVREPVPVHHDGTAKQAMAAEWDAGERNVARQICSRFGVEHATELLETLGLFTADRYAGAALGTNSLQHSG